MNLGWLFESFVIHFTSMQRDYTTENYTSYLPTGIETRILMSGFFIGLFSLIKTNEQQAHNKKADYELY